MSEQLTQYDVETEIAAYDDAEDMGLISDYDWTNLVVRFLETYRNDRG